MVLLYRPRCSVVVPDTAARSLHQFRTAQLVEASSQLRLDLPPLLISRFSPRSEKIKKRRRSSRLSLAVPSTGHAVRWVGRWDPAGSALTAAVEQQK
jgi:hypothetical protein